MTYPGDIRGCVAAGGVGVGARYGIAVDESIDSTNDMSWKKEKKRTRDGEKREREMQKRRKGEKERT